ncbi:ribosome maturation factor RimM [Methyloversatilis thermotolerans]|uniref:ribosome maturation factor RimM n=1 Tax=Methyloversatilis thermotolerans TaxID=1346290 RepID=UPI000373261E|nr:ribosome maturation factor RimM [Methyloversatilis thermotolerans]
MVVLGRIAAPFGVQGWLHIQVFGDDPQTWKVIEHWYASREADAPATRWSLLEPDGFKLQTKGPVIRFRGYPDRTAAEALVGFYLAVPKQDLPDTGEGEYYWGDLVGLEVTNLQGQRLGRVERLMETGANDVLVVRDAVAGTDKAVERLIPFVSAVVKTVDQEAGRLSVDWDFQW